MQVENTASIHNDFLRLSYRTDIGPRITGLYAEGVQGNLLAETPDVHWETPHGEFFLLGGHRLWTAPEDPFYTCPDGKVQVTQQGDAVTLVSGVDASGLEKQVQVRLEANRVHLLHQITWHGSEPIRLAMWGITQLRLGGLAVLPFSRQNGLQPDRNFVLWPYTDLKDERLELHNDMILLRGMPGEHACKVGSLNTAGWLACAMNDVLFVKEFQVDAASTYPDMGCNTEAYVWDSCIELESLGVLNTLTTGDSLTHEETWHVTVGEFPATLETARMVYENLSSKEI